MDEVPEPEEIDESFEPYDEDMDGRVGFQETVEVDATREWRRSKCPRDGLGTRANSGRSRGLPRRLPRRVAPRETTL